MTVDTLGMIQSWRLAWLIVRLFNSNNPTNPETEEKDYAATSS